MKLRLLRDFILLEERKETTTESGLVLPEDMDAEPSCLGVVVRKSKESKCDAKEGETVLFKDYSFDRISIDGKEYRIGRDEGIFGIL